MKTILLTQLNNLPTEVFEIKRRCEHRYDVLKRVNDISIGGKVFRQVDCELCGKYRYKINPAKYHPALLSEIIFIKQL